MGDETVPVNAISEVVEALRRAESDKLRELSMIRDSLAKFTGMAVALPEDSMRPASVEFADLGPIEAIRRFMTEVKEPQSTRQLADALLARGLRTQSKNFVASIHATLRNAPKDFHRNERGQWALGPDVKRLKELGEAATK